MEPCRWSEGRHNYVGVSLQEIRATTQVMIGVSLRAIWDATLVGIIIIVTIAEMMRYVDSVPPDYDLSARDTNVTG